MDTEMSIVKQPGTELRKVHNIPNSPFTTIEENGKYFIALGMYKLTDDFDNQQSAEQKVSPKNWEFLMSVMSAIVLITNNQNQ